MCLHILFMICLKLSYVIEDINSELKLTVI